MKKGIFLAVLFFIPGCDVAPKTMPIAKALTCGCPRVAVEGVIGNRGPNYFSGAKFVLKDTSGEIDVRAWLPMEVAPYHPDAVEEIQKRGDKWPPETMASYLDMPVRLSGRIEGNVLVVDHAEKIQK